MGIAGERIKRLVLATLTLWVFLPMAAASAQEPTRTGEEVRASATAPKRPRLDQLARSASLSQAFSDALAKKVPVEELPANVRDKARSILEQPMLSAKGPVEVFRGQPALYRWFLDHPDEAAKLWRQLGAKCAEITAQGEDRFHWSDGRGSELRWETVHAGPTMQVWYAEGSGSPGPLLPAMPVRALVVLRHAEGCDALGRPLIAHQGELFVQTDSKTAALLTRLLGPAAPKLAKNCLSQMEIFFSLLVCYLEQS